MYKAMNFSARFIKKAVLVLLAASLFLSCNKDGKGKASGDALDADTSYAFGMLMASYLGGMGLVGLNFDYDSFTKGFKAYNEAEETRFTPERAMELINTAVTQMQSQQDETQWLESEQNREAGDAFREENAAKRGVTKTASGLQYEVITQGTGRKPGPQDRVRVHYEGTLISGEIFDSSHQRGAPAEFRLNEVISGWTEGLQLMNEGSSFIFVIPPELAYGPGGSGSIPANSTLVFQVDLLAVID